LEFTLTQEGLILREALSVRPVSDAIGFRMWGLDGNLDCKSKVIGVGIANPD